MNIEAKKIFRYSVCILFYVAVIMYYLMLGFDISFFQSSLFVPIVLWSLIIVAFIDYGADIRSIETYGKIFKSLDSPLGIISQLLKIALIIISIGCFIIYMGVTLVFFYGLLMEDISRFFYIFIPLIHCFTIILIFFIICANWE